MSAPALALMAVALITTEPGDITPRDKPVPAELQHKGDTRGYAIYPGKPLRFDVEAPATLEVAVRAMLKPNRKRARVQLRIRAGRQTLLDQSQVLGIDRRAKGEQAISRPLVAVADIPPGPRRFSVEVKGQADAVERLMVAVTTVKFTEIEATSGGSGEDLMVPGLVGLEPSAPVPAADASAPQAAPIAAPSSAAAEVETPAPPYEATRRVGLELDLAVGLGIPGVDLGVRYYLPFWGERLSLGLRGGYVFSSAISLTDPLVVPTRVELGLHLFPVVLFAEAELLRQDLGPGRLFAGLRGDAGLVPFSGALVEETLLSNCERHRTETALGGFTWCAGGSLLAGFDSPAGAFVVDLGYLYAPDASARSEDEPRRAVSTRVLGPRLGLGYRFSF